MGGTFKKSKPETPAIENTPVLQPIENNEGVLFDNELEYTLKNMTTNTRFFKTYYDREHKWIWNGYPVKLPGGTEVEINNKKYNITRGIQNVFTQSSNIPLKKLKNQGREIYNKILETLDFENYKPKSGESKSGR